MTDLGFQAQVEKHFDFLSSERGYTCVGSNPHRVRFESPTTYVDVVFDRDRSYELCLMIRIAGSADGPFTMEEVLRLRGAPEMASFSLVQVTSQESLAKWMAKFAETLLAYGDDLIEGNEVGFAALARQRRQDVEAYAVQLDLRAARADAELAWRRKDYAGVIKSLKPLRDELTAAEVKKLEYAERSLGY